MTRLQISRKLTPESSNVFSEWQRRYFGADPSIEKINPSPTIAVVGRKLLQEYFLSKPKDDISIPEGLTKHISMYPLGISVRPPLGREGFAMVNMVFDEPDVFIEQRTEILTQNGAELRVGHFNPNLHVVSIRIADVALDSVAAAVNDRPEVLHFMPAEVESF